MDLVFDGAPGKVGILGAQFAGEVAFAYENLRALHGAFSVVIKHHNAMDPEQLSGVSSNPGRFSPS